MERALFHVDGKDFFTIGGQLNNSTAADIERTEHAFALCARLGLNTVAAPVAWELFEPTEGEYDFSHIDSLIELARRTGMKLIVLWFGSWKNGNSHYVPRWMKQDKLRFPLARSQEGFEIRALSPHSEESCLADAKAFRTLCHRIAENNGDGCVIGVQIENEPGLIGTARDYSPAATALYQAHIPKEAAELAGADGSWEQVFGFYAAEYFTAYAVASYVDKVAAAGKEELALPMYVNVWLGEMYAHIPGANYPSGGAVTRTFALWKRVLRHVDAIAPDVYLSDSQAVDALMHTYSDYGNPLYVPESSPAPLPMMNFMRAIAERGLCGLHTFGIDYLEESDSQRLTVLELSGLEAAAKSAYIREILDTYRILRYSRPLIERYQGTGKLHAVYQYEGQANMTLDFSTYLGEVEYLNQESEPINGGNVRRMDNRHRAHHYPAYRAKGFIVQESDSVFFLTGDAYKLKLYPKTSLEELTAASHAGDFLNTRSLGYLSVTEGEMDEDGQYHSRAYRNGDENDYGVWVTSDVGIVRVEMDS